MSDELRDIDRRVAEAIGEDWAWVMQDKYRHYEDAVAWEGQEKVPLEFHTDPRAAWMLLEYILTKKQCDLDFGSPRGIPGGDIYKFVVNLHDDTIATYWGESKNSWPLALCRAFLKAVGGEK